MERARVRFYLAELSFFLFEKNPSFVFNIATLVLPPLLLWPVPQSL